VVQSARLDSDHPGISTEYLARAAHSALIDEMRRRRRRSEIGEGSDVLSHRPDLSPAGPEASLLAREISRHIIGCLVALPEQRRIASTLKLLGYSVGEISDLMRWPYKRTENLVYRGRANLRRCLEAKGVRP
jgi:RNA polymerase sigma-70 factor (ECF subfamily)